MLLRKIITLLKTKAKALLLQTQLNHLGSHEFQLNQEEMHLNHRRKKA
jgi:hypothetical protein